MSESVIPKDEYEALQECVYLNQASLGLIPKATTKTMVGLLTEVGQFGNLRLSDTAETRILDDVRIAAADVMDAPLAGIALVGGASEALGQIAALLATPDGEVVLVDSDFPSVTYPWLNARNRIGIRLKWVPDRPDEDLTESILQAIDDQTTVICVSAVQYATGTRVDVGSVVSRAREVGARVVVDVTQMAGATPVSMRRWGPDAMVCSGYKWLSTHGGVAVLAVSERLQEETPFSVGWMGSENPFDFDPGSLDLAPDARKFQLSTIAYISAVGLGSSLSLLTGIGFQTIGEHASGLSRELVEAVEPLGWKPYRPLDQPSASHHIVSLKHTGIPANEAQARLASQGVIVSSRGGGIRVSVHCYNDSDDVDALATALRSLK